MSFWTKLENSVEKRNSLLCVGLDPHPGRLPDGYSDVASFMKAIVEQTADIACVFKPNIAFYEALGPAGWTVLQEVLSAIPDDVPVLLDAKRSDITSTADAYARGGFEALGADAMTVNPYLGQDGVQPFLAHRDKGVFLLCKTSNPGAGAIQDWMQHGEPLYQHVADLARQWAGDQQIGLVIGATYPETMAEVREQHPDIWFLVPGVGAQGGDLEALLSAGLRSDGSGLIVSASRSIIYAQDPRQAAIELRDAINAQRTRMGQGARTSLRQSRIRRLAAALYEVGCVQLGDFVLHSGAHSPIYVDLRRLVNNPRVLELAASEYQRLLAGLDYARIAAIPYAGLPIGTAVSLLTRDPLIYPRREAKSYGTRRAIEGEYQAGERVVLLDDLISSGGSKLEAAEPLQQAGLVVEDVVVLIDREQGGAQDLAAHGMRLHAACTLREIVAALVELGKLDAQTAETVEQYLNGAS
ncbi:MAG: orotidine-5'-phosphate decarboxylase [Anaerolineae bacterium]|jgi:uridine monophosphate synthetase|nr:orotidine-5'-phosphate decarboxylase [Chloroflexota bacterium]